MLSEKRWVKKIHRNWTHNNAKSWIYIKVLHIGCHQHVSHIDHAVQDILYNIRSSITDIFSTANMIHLLLQFRYHKCSADTDISCVKPWIRFIGLQISRWLASRMGKQYITEGWCLSFKFKCTLFCLKAWNPDIKLAEELFP